MALKSFLEKTFLGETLVEKIISPINGEINVYGGWFGRNMRIGGITQSGELVEGVWKIGTKAISNKQLAISNCLILGLGAGDVAKLVSKKWPEAQITGIEIDQRVVEVGKKYFGLGEVDNLTIKIDDAFDSCHKLSAISYQPKYDLILIDLYVGKDYPKEVESEEFLNEVKKLLNGSGVAIFNRLSYGEYEKPANEFAEKLRQYFPKLWTKKAITNLLIFCQV